MILEHIHKKIESTKFLIQRDNLIMPSDNEREIAHIVTNQISKYKESKSKLLDSDYETEISKVSNALIKYFGNDIYEKYNQENSFIRQINTQNYSTEFILNIPLVINIPIELNETSHIFIGHEIIHVLKDGKNDNEWIYTLIYSEVLPMLYELIQSENSTIGHKVLNWRINKLLYMYNNAYREEIYHILKNYTELIDYYQIPENIYFISFYYTILLYSIYLKDKTKVLEEIQKVLNQEITTKELLEEFGLLNKINQNTFYNEYQKLILKI